MSVTTARARVSETPPEREEKTGDMPLGPREGWTALLAVGVMMLIVALAIDGAHWAGMAPGSATDTQTRFLPVASLLSVLIGALLAKRTVRPIVAHVIGSIVGAVYLLVAVAGTIARAPALEVRLRTLNDSVSSFITDVFVEGGRSTETSVFLLVIGALVWGAGQFAAFTVFRRHRAGPPIVLAGLMLLLNVSITVQDQYVHLMIFAAAALALLMRLNLFEQAREWRERGMRDVAELSESFLRSGAVMVALVVVASITLAANASSAPLARAWNDVDDQLIEIGSSVNRLLGGVTGPARGPNVMFTPSQTIRDFWQSSTEEVFTARVSDGVGRRWRGATYDSFDGRTWQQLDRQPVLVEPGEVLLSGTVDGAPSGPGWVNVDVSVTPLELGGDVFVAPYYPRSVSQPAELLTHGPGGPFVSGKLAFGLQSGVSYDVQATVRRTTGSGRLTANQLASEGTSYAPWVERYLEIRPGSIGERTEQVAREILESVPANKRNPYHIAEAVQDYLYRTGDFTYSTDVRGACDGQNLVDCFLEIRQGYCEYFATAMVMLLRELNIPARYVLGYLPGREQADSSWLVDRSAAHAWVEVYFAGSGWVEFDPTPGNDENGQEPTRLPAGDPLPSGPPLAPDDPGGGRGGGFACERNPFDPECDEEEETPTAAEPAAPPPGPNILTPILLGLLGLFVGGVLLFALYRRVPTTEPALAFNSLSRLAGRLGYGPRPAQTTYEYADRLGELVPVARNDLRLIAMAKVESTYARRAPGDSTVEMIANAYRRARVGLLRLIVRRGRPG